MSILCLSIFSSNCANLVQFVWEFSIAMNYVHLIYFYRHSRDSDALAVTHALPRLPAWNANFV